MRHIISIHAPLTGCDYLETALILNYHHFNPRTPYGMRQEELSLISDIDIFQSTHPLRDATQSKNINDYEQVDFNPRTPYGMRPF